MHPRPHASAVSGHARLLGRAPLDTHTRTRARAHATTHNNNNNNNYAFRFVLPLLLKRFA